MPRQPLSSSAPHPSVGPKARGPTGRLASRHPSRRSRPSSVPCVLKSGLEEAGRFSAQRRSRSSPRQTSRSD
eukprot:7942043-Pyramimonas_sp.AAC.1